MHRTRTRIAARTITLISVIGIAAAACSGSGTRAPTATPAPPSTPAPGAPAATATPAPADPALAARLRANGEYDAAIGVYAAIAASSAGAGRQRALLAQAQLLVRQQRSADAIPVLRAYLAAAAGADASEATYMLASALDDAGDPLHALDGYTRYIAAGGPLADFARIEQAKLLARLGRVADAEAAADRVMASPILPAFKSSFMFSIGKAFDDGGAATDALAWYARARDAGDDVAAALARIGAIEKRHGDAAWSAHYLRAVAIAPERAFAASLLAELDAAGVPVAEYLRGVVDYRAGRDAGARAALARAAAAGDHAAEATYYIAAIDERAGNVTDAIAGYQRAHDLDPTGALADSALWWRGRLLEHAGRAADATATYQALIDAYPLSKWAADAAFHRGLVLYRAADYAAAAAAWAAPPVADAETVARSRFWHARALLAANDAGARAALQQLVDATDPGAPGAYYALRAEVLLGKNDARKRTPALSLRSTDWSRIAAWVRDATGADPQRAALPGGSQWDVAAALDDVGLHAQSDAVYRGLVRDHARDAAAMFQITRRLATDGRTSAAARAATTLAALLAGPARPAPDDLLRIAYPLAYRDLAASAAAAAGVSPTLLLALVRQESFYDPAAGSGAGALGITQVLPSTGAAIAARIGAASFTASDLYRPDVSLRFGATYLAEQLRSFGGNPYRALAAYNGGPGAAASAAAAAGSDDDLFVEDLEFDETRSYVRLVMENYARYRQLYEGTGRPTLPR